MIRLLTAVEGSVAEDMFLRFSITLVGALMSCFPAMSLWGEFHKARLSEKVHAAWCKLTSSTFLEQGTIAIAFQLLVTFCMKILIKKKSDEQSPVHEVHVCEVHELSLREKNVIRYVAGYVILKLRNKVSKRRKRTVDSKEQWFYSILTSSSMPDTSMCHLFSSIEEYTEQWVEQRARGGLYSINEEVQMHVYAYMPLNENNKSLHIKNLRFRNSWRK